MGKLGHYEILGELGRGGCGVVYRALDPSIGRTVAIKTILAEGDASKERFRREARSAGILSHPNIVTIHEFNDTGDVMFIAMEFIDGQTLAQRMSQPKLPLDFVLNTVRSAADALDFAHSNNIVHRDVKPANFLITKQGHLKITDFGIAKMLDSDVSLTNTGMVIGTVQYISPEQIGAQEITGKSDQFSLAVIVYEMLTGQRPFQGNSWATMIHSIMSTEPHPLNKYREDLGEGPTSVLRKALSKDPAARYATCIEFSDALERSILGNTDERRAFWDKPTVRMDHRADPGWHETALMDVPPTAIIATKEKTSQPTVVAPPGPAKNRSWKLPVAAGAVVGLGIAGGLIFRSSNSQQAPQPAPAAQSQVAASPQTPAAPEQTASQTSQAQSPAPEPAPAANPQKSTPVEATSAARPIPAAERQSRPAPPAASPIKASPAPIITAPAPVQAPASAASTTPPPAAPTPVATAPAPTQPPPQPVARFEPPPISAPPAAAPAPVTPAPNPVAAPAPPRGPDPAEIAAQKRAADLRAANKAIGEAVSHYIRAFEARDLFALKAVWPTLSRGEQSSFQGFFRIARSVKLQMTPIGEPEITATGATAQFQRSLSASDDRRALPAQNQTVKITFRKSGEQMFIDSIEAIGR